MAAAAMQGIVPQDKTIKDKYASLLTRKQVQKDLTFLKPEQFNEPKFKNLIDNTAPRDVNGFPARPKEVSNAPKKEELKVCIVGAGISGLYAAWILKLLGVPYEILEASDRIGGRVYTHYFGDDKEEAKKHHQYYDIGCMRFPDTPVMAR